MTKLSELLKQRAAAYDAFKVLADKPTLTADEETEYPTLRRSVQDLDSQITRAREAQELAAAGAQPVAGQDNPSTTPAAVENDRYVREKSLVVGGAMKMLGRSAGIISVARADAVGLYGENHPVTRALSASQGSAGGFIVPPDYMNEIIELLRPRAVVRAAGPRVIPMPRGTMTLPGQSSAASAGYGPEGGVFPLRSRASARSWPATRSSWRWCRSRTT
jgi:HK97 family phage major capsid protein